MDELEPRSEPDHAQRAAQRKGWMQGTRSALRVMAYRSCSDRDGIMVHVEPEGGSAEIVIRWARGYGRSIEHVCLVLSVTELQTPSSKYVDRLAAKMRAAVVQTFPVVYRFEDERAARYRRCMVRP